MPANPYDRYKEVQVTTNRGSRRVVQLYDRALRHLESARAKSQGLEGADAVTREQQSREVDHLVPVRKIVATLQQALKLDGSWDGEKGLFVLYQHLISLLDEARVKPEALGEAIAIMRTLREAWQQAAIKTDAEPQPPQSSGRSELV